MNKIFCHYYYLFFKIEIKIKCLETFCPKKCKPFGMCYLLFGNWVHNRRCK